jgi:hypothetical protein
VRPPPPIARVGGGLGQVGRPDVAGGEPVGACTESQDLHQLVGDIGAEKTEHQASEHAGRLRRSWRS